jgi:hypothetical protein
MKNIIDRVNENFNIITTKYTVHRICILVIGPLQMFKETEILMLIDLWSRTLRKLQ